MRSVLIRTKHWNLDPNFKKWWFSFCCIVSWLTFYWQDVLFGEIIFYNSVAQPNREIDIDSVLHIQQLLKQNEVQCALQGSHCLLIPRWTAVIEFLSHFSALSFTLERFLMRPLHRTQQLKIQNFHCAWSVKNLAEVGHVLQTTLSKFLMYDVQVFFMSRKRTEKSFQNSEREQQFMVVIWLFPSLWYMWSEFGAQYSEYLSIS